MEDSAPVLAQLLDGVNQTLSYKVKIKVRTYTGQVHSYLSHSPRKILNDNVGFEAWCCLLFTVRKV